MNIIGYVVMGFLVIILVHDLNSWVVEDGSKIKAEAIKVNALPFDGVKIIVTMFVGWMTISMGVLFGGVYLWIASMGIAKILGIVLALLNVTYVVHHFEYYVRFKLPEEFPWWWRPAVAVEVFLGIPYLLLGLLRLIGG